MENITQKQAKYIKSKLLAQTPNMVSGNWCFFKTEGEPKFERGFKFKNQWYAVTYQTGSGFHFLVRV